MLSDKHRNAEILFAGRFHACVHAGHPTAPGRFAPPVLGSTCLTPRLPLPLLVLFGCSHFETSCIRNCCGRSRVSSPW